MTNFFLILSLLFSLHDSDFIINQFQNNPDLYINTVHENFSELDATSNNEIDNLYTFVKAHSINPINSKDLKEEIFQAIINSLNDDYSYLDNRSSKSYLESLEGNYDGFGFDLDIFEYKNENRFIVCNILSNSPAEKTGIRIGDVLESINDIPVHANNKLYLGALELKGEEAEHNFTLIRNEEKINIKIAQKLYKEPAVESKIIDKDIYYIKINNCSLDMPSLVENELKSFNQFKFNNMIIDLRTNRGGFESSAIKVISMFSRDDVLGYEMTKNGKKPLRRADVEQIVNTKPVVLISKFTASSAELLADQLKIYSEATLVGSKTYGKNRAQGIYDFGGRSLKFSNAYISADDNFELNFSGISPDIIIDELYPIPYEDKALSKAKELLK